MTFQAAPQASQQQQLHCCQRIAELETSSERFDCVKVNEVHRMQSSTRVTVSALINPCLENQMAQDLGGVSPSPSI